MTFIGNKNFLTEVAKDNVAGHSLVRKFGFNPDIDDAATYEDVWSPGGTKTWQTSAQSLEITSSDADDIITTGSGARTVRVYTLDSSHDLSTEDVDMNGTGVTALTGTHFECYRAYVLTSGTSLTNEGDIDIQVASGGDVLAQIPAGYGQTEQALYIVPNGYTGYVLSWGIGLIAKGQTPVCEGRLKIKEDSGSWRVVDVRELGLLEPLQAPISLPEKTIVVVEATSDTNNAAVRGELTILLVED